MLHGGRREGGRERKGERGGAMVNPSGGEEQIQRKKRVTTRLLHTRDKDVRILLIRAIAQVYMYNKSYNELA